MFWIIRWIRRLVHQVLFLHFENQLHSSHFFVAYLYLTIWIGLGSSSVWLIKSSARTRRRLQLFACFGAKPCSGSSTPLNWWKDTLKKYIIPPPHSLFTGVTSVPRSFEEKNATFPSTSVPIIPKGKEWRCHLTVLSSLKSFVSLQKKIPRYLVLLPV